jgi:hypothetical protein
VAVPLPEANKVVDQLERDPVTVVEDPDASASAPRRQRVGASDLLAAIRALPDAVAARLDGGEAHGDSEGGAPEVTFVGDDPLPTTAVEPVAPAEAGPNGVKPDPAVHRPAFTHPSRRRRRTEAIA